MLLLNTKLKFETGMSDFHQVIIIIFEVKTDKLPSGIIKYMDYENSERKAFTKKLQVSVKNFHMNVSSFTELKATLMDF